MNTRTTIVAVLGLSPLLAQTNWTLLAPAASPPPFTAHAMAYHLPTDRTVLFGGTWQGVRYDETWTWDGATWTQATPANVPTARVAHAMAYDVFRGRLVMFGGIPAGGGLLGDTWEWDGVDWQLMTPAVSPPARRSHPMAWHPSRGRVVLWGGYSSFDLNDMWEWDGTTWSQIVTTTSPTPRRASDMAYDPVNDGLLLFSGYLQTNDTWLFQGNDWTQLLPTTSPSPRYDHSMVTDPVRNRIVTFGGPGAADTWEWDGANWLQRTTPTVPAARSDTYLAWDVVREQIVMFGSVAVPETWTYAPTLAGSVTSIGVGCPGTLGLATTSTNERPWLGETFQAYVGLVPAGTIAAMGYGLSNTTSSLGPLPASLAPAGMPGCDLQVDPVVIDAFLAPNGVGVWQRPIPNAAVFYGATLYAQGAALDAINAAGIIVTNHIAFTIGGK